MLPGLLFDSKKVIDSIYNNFGDHVFISLMNQYTPLYNAKDYPEINKSVNPKLYDSLINYALSIGVKMDLFKVGELIQKSLYLILIIKVFKGID